MSGKPLALLDHMREVGPLNSRDAASMYAMSASTFRGLIRELRGVVQIQSDDIWINGRKYKEHSLRQ